MHGMMTNVHRAVQKTMTSLEKAAAKGAPSGSKRKPHSPKSASFQGPEAYTASTKRKCARVSVHQISGLTYLQLLGNALPLSGTLLPFS